MKTPAALQPLIDDGVIDEVIRSLKSGKEATVYLVRRAPRAARRSSGHVTAQLPEARALPGRAQGARQPPTPRHRQEHALRAQEQEAA
jgi:serine/threonine-protein kinase RIO1